MDNSVLRGEIVYYITTGGETLPEEMESLQDERAAWQQRAEAAEKQLAAVAMLVSIYDRQDEPEGQVSARRALTAIAETVGREAQRT